VKGDWFKFFGEEKLHLTDDTYEAAHNSLKEDLAIYERHIKRGDSILECCCGPGYTAIPLSHYFKVTGFDRDERVLEAARENAGKYGKDMEFVEADFFQIMDKLGKDSFNACSSGGVLEHFKKEDVRKLMDAQLTVAPIVFASMPLFTEEQVEEHKSLGIETFHYTKDDWLDEILADYNILEHRVLPERPVFGKFREFMVVVGRKIK